MIEFEEDGPAVTEAEVAAFEAELPAPLPPDYRRFLIERNGGIPAQNWWPPESGDADFGVEVFFSVGAVDDVRSLVEVRAMFASRIPEKYLPVGGDANGNLLCLALLEDRGSVWFFDHELETDPAEGVDPDLLTRVCDSFTDLLETLEPEPDLEEMMRRSGVAGL